MSGLMYSFRHKGEDKRGQWGFTLIEFMIALAVGGLILVGTAAVMRSLIITTNDASDKSLARLEVQYANFWINNDVVQAQNITVSNIADSSYPITPFLEVQAVYGAGNVTTPINYYVGNMTDKLGNNLWKLYRETVSGTSVVAEYLDPSSTSCRSELIDSETNRYALVLEVTSQVDRQSSSQIYEIYPRLGNKTVWLP